MKIHPIPALVGTYDNYIWVISDQPNSNQCIVVDPGEAEPIVKYLQDTKLEPKAILITHRHGDHVNAVSPLLTLFPDCKVYASTSTPLDRVDQRLSQDDKIKFDWLNLEFNIIEVPGHTSDQIAFYDPMAELLFCGDILFSVGCGRMFEGTPEEFHRSLATLRDLPDSTSVYCAHEYTQDNIGFALWVEPDNEALKKLKLKVDQKIKNNEPTLPSNIGLENAVNPFLRFDVPNVVEAASQWKGKSLNSPSDVFASLREWKDTDYD